MVKNIFFLDIIKYTIFNISIMKFKYLKITFLYIIIDYILNNLKNIN
jgi:hypothetical protein